LIISALGIHNKETKMNLLGRKWFVPMLSVVLAFLGALGGSMVSGMYQKNLWENQIIYEKKKTVLEQRVALLEKLSRLANTASQMRTYNDYLILQANLAQIYTECEKAKQKSCIKPDDAKTVSEVNIKRSELNSGYSSTLQLIKVFFSPAIQLKLKELASQKDWWSPEAEPKFRALIAKMSEEIDAI
jgi:hypothetical protein